MAYGEWCPKCGSEIIAVTRGIPSMGRCTNGHMTDRRDCLRREPEPDLIPKAERDALVAEAYRAGVEDALDRIDDFNTLPPDESGHRWRESDLLDQEVMSIRDLTPADAIAAREARDKRVREAALREAAALIDRKIKAVQPEMSRRAQRLAESKKPGFQYAIHRADLDARMSDRDAILALIEKGPNQ